MTEKLELEEYLTTLLSGEYRTSRPFDKKSDITAVMGPEAKALKIPDIPMEQIIPPREMIVKGIYLLLEPVLNELVKNSAFDWQLSYGSLSAKDVAKGYLFNAITSSMLKDRPFTPQELGLQIFLRHVSDAYVDGISAEKAISTFADKPHVQSQFGSMVISMSLTRPTKQDLIKSYLADNRFVMAYQASLFDESEFEKGVCDDLKQTLLTVMDIVKKHYKPHFWNKNKEAFSLSPKTINETTGIPALLYYFSTVLKEIRKTNSRTFMDETLTEIKKSSFFLQHSVDLSDDSRQELKMAMDKLIKDIDHVNEKLTSSKIKEGLTSWTPAYPQPTTGFRGSI
ncbi:hypothetical protein [Legionella taurinensis]|nr:hypothetical protein [Legionella taurinensis]RJT66597.1 hypothetical protein D6J03_09770 [Legionella taurinensis]STY25244.1 Uncharacterised protein [Legionella taurinensis]